MDSLLVPLRGRRDDLDSKHRGLTLRVSQGGTKTWVLEYQNKLGRTGDGRSCAIRKCQLQRHANSLRFGAARLGRAPIRAEQKQTQRHAETFAELAAMYLEQHASKKRLNGRPSRFASGEV